MMFGRLDVLNAFSTYGYFHLTMGLSSQVEEDLYLHSTGAIVDVGTF